jgi:signal transduction histidine kinase
VTQPVLGVPLQGDGELLGFFVFGAAPGGSYDDDDRDLLRAIAHHVAVLLTNTRLAEERQAAAELDALNRFSAFYVHDLKNLNARLSLVAQNAATHSNDPAFRETAMRTVARTSQEMGELIARLARRSPALGRLQPVDLGELVESVVASLGSDFHAEIVRPQVGLSPTLAVTQQLQQVLLNLFLNAKRASAAAAGEGEPPPVRVAIGEGAGRISIEIADRGCGIAPERLRTLFRPLRSDSPGGLGIGLYESKRIIESYRGSLRVESAPGRGTRVILELPAVAPEREVEHTAAKDKELQS